MPLSLSYLLIYVFDKDKHVTCHLVLSTGLLKEESNFCIYSHLLDGEIWCSYPVKHVAEVFFRVVESCTLHILET